MPTKKKRPTRGIYVVIRVGHSFGPRIERAHNPTKVHTVLEEARDEAIRLARENINVRFGVFRCDEFCFAGQPPVQTYKPSQAEISEVTDGPIF